MVKCLKQTKGLWTCRTFWMSYILILCKSAGLFHAGLLFNSMCQGLVCHLEIKIILLDVHIVMDIHTHTQAPMCNHMMRSCHVFLGCDWWLKIMAHKQTLPPPTRPPTMNKATPLSRSSPLALRADSRGEDIWHLFNTISSSVVALLREGGKNYDRRLLKLKATRCQTEAEVKEKEWRFLFRRCTVFSGPFPETVPCAQPHQVF